MSDVALSARAIARRVLPQWLRTKLRAGQNKLKRFGGENDAIAENLGRQLLCLDSGLGLFRLVHLLDALGDRHPRTIVSVGCGGGIHEAFLARRFPRSTVIGIDLREPSKEFSRPNLRLIQGNVLDPAFRGSIPAADFVFSLECFEHIQEDREAFEATAALVAPGGLLYVEVPFANEAEQADVELCRRELETFEHVRPGYSPDQLRQLAESNGLSVRRLAGAFWFPTQPIVWAAYERFGAASLAPHWRTILSIAELDLKDGLPESRNSAVAVKMLAERKS